MLNVNIIILKTAFSVNRLNIFSAKFDYLCYTQIMTKAEIRKEIKARIAALPASELKAQSDALCKKIISSDNYTCCDVLLAYMPLADEADITPLISHALEHNKEVYLPRITPGTNQMEFYRYEAADQTAPGSFGITEPLADEARNFLRLADSAAAAPAPQSCPKILMLVPGRAFTKDGRRLGRGKGFYDIYFSRLAACPFYADIKKSGVCLACQLVADLPVTPDDVVMDSVVSPGSTTDLTISEE